MPAAETLSERDALARRAAQEEYLLPLVIEAGAGTGKTSTLVARIVVWCLGTGWERAEAAGHTTEAASKVLGRVAAITFTDAAAAEMEERVGLALREIEAGEIPLGVEETLLPAEPELRRRRAHELLAARHRLTVQTIHAFCRRLLVAHPLEADIHPRFEVDADGAQCEEVTREVVERALREAYSDPPDPDYLALARETVGPPEIALALKELIDAGVPGSALREDPFSEVRIRDFQERLRAHLEALLAFLPRIGGTPTANLAAERLEGLSHLVDSAELSSRPQLEAFSEQWNELASDQVIKRLEEWGKDKLAKGERASFGEHAQEIGQAAARLVPQLKNVSALRPEFLDTLRRVLSVLLEQVEDELRTRGIATFASLLSEAHGVLKRKPQVAAAIRGGMDQLLVDEFQDTDPTQCSIIEHLALTGPGEDRPGLFIVGDPKQSIYGWRSADLRSYSRFRNRVEEEGGTIHLLSRNYRSAPEILSEVEAVVEPSMQEEPGRQPRFEPLLPREVPPVAFRSDDQAEVEYWISWEMDPNTRGALAKTRSGEANRIEAHALAQDLRRLHDEQNVEWHDVGILFRTRGDVESYLGALRDAGVPYAIEGDRSYYQRREVIETCALVRSILDPNDQLALLTVLRSTFIGVPDAALIPLWRRGFPAEAAELHGANTLESLTRNIREVAAELTPAEIPGLRALQGWEQNLISAMHSIGALRRAFESEPPDRFVELMRQYFLMEATEAARYLGNYRIANLERLFDALVQDLIAAGGEPRTLLRRLRRRVAERSDEEEARPKETRLDAVRICTIHQAKGLEFAHVYLMQLHKGNRRGTSRFLAGQLGEHFEYQINGAPSLGVGSLLQQRSDVEAAERVRSLYVAMTRAKQRLVLAGNWSTTPPAPADRAANHMDLLKRRAPEVPDLPEQLARVEGNRFRAHGALWVFPGRSSPDAESKMSPVDRATAVPSRADVSREASALERDRQNAAERAARPFRSAVSDETDHERRPQVTEKTDGRGARRPVALAVGTAIHRVLEELDLFADPVPQLENARQKIEAELRREVAAEDRSRALADARELLDQLESGSVLRRLLELGDAVIARELPLQCAPEPEGSGAVGFVGGALDLVYRDPTTTEWVVADYKTDRVASPEELRERAGGYAAQGRAYTRGLRQALGLDHTPRFELWFLRADTIVVQAEAQD